MRDTASELYFVGAEILYEKLSVGSQPMRIRKYCTIINNSKYSAEYQTLKFE